MCVIFLYLCKKHNIRLFNYILSKLIVNKFTVKGEDIINKKMILSLIFTTLIFLSIGLIPQYIRSSYTEIELIGIDKVSYTKTYENIGIVKKNSSVELIANRDMIIENKLFNDNDDIQKGEKLANISFETYTSLVHSKNIKNDLDKYLEIEKFIKNTGIEIDNQDIRAVISNIEDKINIDSANIENELIAPISGNIEWSIFGNEIFVDRGETICKIYNNNDVKIYCPINEKEIYKYKLGMKATVNSNVSSYTGYVTDIKRSTSTTPTKNGFDTTVDLVISIKNGEKLILGSTVECIISEPKATELLLVPFSAINQDSVGEYVIAINHGSYEKRYINVGEDFGDNISIKSGINENELIVEDISNFNLQDKYIIK